MATAVLMPKQGQSVETCLILAWEKAPGDQVVEGDILCQVETDKAAFEVEATADGVLLETFFEEGDDVKVLVAIAAIGEAGEDVEELRPKPEDLVVAADEAADDGAPASAAAAPGAPAPAGLAVAGGGAISPRARKLAAANGLPTGGLAGSGPEGRIIERDVRAALEGRQPLTPAAKARIASGGLEAPARGSGIGGRVLASDLLPASKSAATPVLAGVEGATVIPIKGVRKLIAERMLQSVQEAAQLTLNAAADVSAMLAYRKRLKANPGEVGGRKITVNDLVLLATARTLLDFPEVNSWFDGAQVYQFEPVHLAFAVDTPRGLMVPVIREAQALGIEEISDQAKELGQACQNGAINPDLLQGGTFTVTNLGIFGIDSFSPILNPPQVAILGVGGINLRPVAGDDGEVQFAPRIGLSLTINHMVVDGGPAARFLQALAQALATIDELVAT